MQDSKNKELLWIVAAGTGGHIFPGLNIVEEWKKTYPESEFQFFGDRARLEARIVPSKGYKIEFLSSGMWKGSGLLARVGALLAIVAGVFQALKKSFQRKPILLLSVGGYVSVPVALACILRRIPFFILEPNIKAGMANRILSRFAKAVFTTPGSDALKVMKAPVFEFGNPVRKDLKEIVINDELKRVLILGGSQGAMMLCRWAMELLAAPELADGRIEITLQAGELNHQQALDWAKEFGVDVWLNVLPFIDNVPKALLHADLVIARAGAMTVAELALAGMPTIFVPYPFAADNHQALNARLLVNEGAALMVEESQTDALQVLKSKIVELADGATGLQARRAMSARFKKWSRPNAQAEIVGKMAELAGVKPEAKKL